MGGGFPQTPGPNPPSRESCILPPLSPWTFLPGFGGLHTAEANQGWHCSEEETTMLQWIFFSKQSFFNFLCILTSFYFPLISQTVFLAQFKRTDSSKLTTCSTDFNIFLAYFLMAKHQVISMHRFPLGLVLYLGSILSKICIFLPNHFVSALIKPWTLSWMVLRSTPVDTSQNSSSNQSLFPPQIQILNSKNWTEIGIRIKGFFSS